MAVASGREEWWRVALWLLAALGLIALFVLGETIVAAVFTQVVFSGADSGSEQFNLPAGGLGLGLFLLVMVTAGVDARRQSHAALCVQLIRKVRAPRAGSGRRRLVEDAA